MVSKLRQLLVIVLCLPLTGAWPNSGRIVGVSSGGAPTYTGPGDIVAGATAWAGLRAYNSTLASAGATTTPVMDVRGSGSGSCTIYLKGNGTGGLDMTTAGAGGIGNQCLLGATTFCTVTNTKCLVSKLYDQSGANACVGAVPCDLTQGTGVAQPALLLSGCSSGSLPCLACSGAQNIMSAAAFTTSTSQPYTLSTVSVTTATTNGAIYSINSGGQNGPEVLWNNGGSNLFAMYAGTSVTASATDGNWYAAQAVFNGVSSVLYLNGASNSPGDPNSATTSGGAPTICQDKFSLLFNGNVAEAGFWPFVFNGTQDSNMNSNQRSYWGF